MPESDYTQKAQPVPPSGPEPPSGPSGGSGGPTQHWQQPGAGPHRVGRYEVRAVLGEGAFGRVYRALDVELGREVAIKVPHPQGLTPAVRERFLREARAAATIHHPNVCPIYDVGTDGDLPFIVMRFIAGGTLSDLLAARRLPPPSKFAVATARQLALGVAAAHAEGVVHRDLKPQNALWDEARRLVVVTDFGLARVGGEAAITGHGDVLGTPSYMAPEQARGDTAAVGPLSDVYSLGVILYRMLTGEPPYHGTVYEIMVKAVEGKPRPPSALRPDLDPGLDALVLKAMAVNPANRFPSAKAFADALGAFLKGMDGEDELPLGEPITDSPHRPADRPPAGTTRGPAEPTPRSNPRSAVPVRPPSPPAPPAPTVVVMCPRCRARMRIAANRAKPVQCPMCDCLFSVAAGRQAAARAGGGNTSGSGARSGAIPVAELDDGDDARSDDGPRPEWRPVAGGLTMAWAGMLLAGFFFAATVAYAVATEDLRRPAAGENIPDPLLYWLGQLAVGLGVAGGLMLMGLGRWRAGAVPAGARGGVSGRFAGAATLIGTAALAGGYALLTRLVWFEPGGVKGDPVTTVAQTALGTGVVWLVLAEWLHTRQLLGVARRVPDFPHLHAATTRVFLLLTLVPAAVGAVAAGYLASFQTGATPPAAVIAGFAISACGTAAFLPVWFLSALWLTGRTAAAVRRHAAGE